LIADVECLPLRQGFGTDIMMSDWLMLVDSIDRITRADPGILGIVVMHGTATIEETAYFLNLCLHTEATVVVSGSLRPPTGYSSDASLNLLHSVRVACSSAARDRGVLVVLDQTIHAARDVRKVGKYRLDSFASPGWGPLGYVDHDKVVLLRTPLSLHYPHAEFDVHAASELQRVDISYSYIGSDGTAIDAFVAVGAKAIVSASFAPGGETPGDIEAISRALEAGVHVVRSSRTAEGRVLPRLGDLMIAAGDLIPAKARILIMLGLSVTDDRNVLQEMFDRY
jgi:L-asparaginase